MLNPSQKKSVTAGKRLGVTRDTGARESAARNRSLRTAPTVKKMGEQRQQANLHSRVRAGTGAATADTYTPPKHRRYPSQMAHPALTDYHERMLRQSTYGRN